MNPKFRHMLLLIVLKYFCGHINWWDGNCEAEPNNQLEAYMESENECVFDGEI